MTVGLVIVSHSATLASGVVELARAMAPEIPIAAAGGFASAPNGLGTDAELIHAAIEQVDSPAGVLVLMDLGSAVLTAETVRDLLDEPRRARVLLCEAPLVEGALAAAVQAQLGSPLAQVAAEARGALQAKQEHFGYAPAPALAPAARFNATTESELIVPNRLGLHARPAARFVQTLARFNVEARLANLSLNKGPVNAKSINAVATLGAQQHHRLRLSLSGPEAHLALEAVQKLAANNFGDSDEAPPVLMSAPPLETADGWRGLPAAPGIAIGPARPLQRRALILPTHSAENPAREWGSLQSALERVRARLRALAVDTARRANPSAAEIFDAHLLFLQDEAWLNAAQHAIAEEGRNAAQAWHSAAQTIAAQYRALEDDYQRSRAIDVDDLSRQVLEELLGATAGPLRHAPGILLAADLTPADTVSLDPAITLGLATALGSPTSHSAILARSLGIPAIVGMGERLNELTEGTPLILDGETGALIPNPDPDTRGLYTQKREQAQRSAAEARAASAQLAFTQDGQRIEVAANIGGAKEAAAAVAAGAEGVGLFRTEFLFLDRQTAPTEDEQYRTYRAAAEALGRERPLIIRTLDVGGDKPLPYVDMGAEANPFLGWRAVRLCLARPDFFKVQLRAIARTAREFPRVRVMFPMIATLDEFRAAKALLAEACAEVGAPPSIETGIMVEIPSAALQARHFAPEVDFFSIGTNDLTQYTLAAERGNARVAALADAFSPAVLKLIGQTAEAARAHGKWAGVCGELAGDPLAAPLLIGLGVTELSMAAPLIPRAKQIIRALDSSAARALAQTALSLDSAAAVREYLTAQHATRL